MPRFISLTRDPAQELSVVIDQIFWELRIRSVGRLMSVTISRNNTALLSGFRIVPGIPLLPYQYQENGNFIFLTENNEYPWWERFGETQSLIFHTAAELEVLRG